EPLDPVAPDGAAPLVLEVRQPVGRLHERRTVAARRIREPHSIGARAETQMVAIAHGIIIHQCRSACGFRTCCLRKIARGMRVGLGRIATIVYLESGPLATFPTRTCAPA